MSTFEGQNIIVTGGASGIGHAIVLLLAERGATVWTSDLSSNPPEDMNGWITQGKVNFQGNLDVADRSASRKYLDSVVKAAGRLDGLVNNAGIGLVEGEIASDEIYDRMLDVNIGGTWTFGTYALQTMAKQQPRGPVGSRGNIVNIASGAGTRGVSRLAAYCATKHAVIGLARAWHEDSGKHNIRVNAVAPGTTATPAYVKRAKEEAGFLELMPSNPLGRPAEPVEIAKAVAFLLSDESSYVGGEVLAVTGGHT